MSKSFENELLNFGIKYQAELWWENYKDENLRRWIVMIKVYPNIIYRERTMKLDEWNNYDNDSKKYVHKEKIWTLIEELEGEFGEQSTTTECNATSIAEASNANASKG